MMALRQARSQDRIDWGDQQTLALADGARALGVEATASQLDSLRRYGALILKWNRTYNLLGATTARAMLEEHLLDSLAVVPTLSRWLPTVGSTIVDVGTGAGLPGIVLSVMLPEARLVLVEPVGKKAAFLRQVVAECALRTVEVHAARIEDVDPGAINPTAINRAINLALDPAAGKHANDVSSRPHFICRAFASLNRFVELCEPHRVEGSLLFAMKAAKVTEELDQLGNAVEVLAVESLRTVEKDVQRNLVVMRSKQAASYPTMPTR
jgi:16S rRNA (guanine527-N7)-methyltransferase